ncbi:MAG: hypothetical protein OXH49_09245 [Gemmatimonadetes bacterium]|nr:hypothetical protein [Gemmatimonadota bacterium]
MEAHETEKEQLRGIAENLGADVIRRYGEATAHRLKAIQHKAIANLLNITIGVAVLFAGFELLAGSGMGVRFTGWLQVTVALVFVVSVLYFLLGGLMALKVLEVKRVFVPRLEEEAEKTEVERSMQALWDLKQNEKTIFVLTNALSSSFSGLRNGVVCLATLVVLLAASVVAANAGFPMAGSSNRAGSSGVVDSVEPAAPTPTHPNHTTEMVTDPPAGVGDTTAVPPAVDTTSGSVTSGDPG